MAQKGKTAWGWDGTTPQRRKYKRQYTRATGETVAGGLAKKYADGNLFWQAKKEKEYGGGSPQLHHSGDHGRQAGAVEV